MLKTAETPDDGSKPVENSNEHLSIQHKISRQHENHRKLEHE
jgi:hypothetical protein